MKFITHSERKTLQKNFASSKEAKYVDHLTDVIFSYMPWILLLGQIFQMRFGTHIRLYTHPEFNQSHNDTKHWQTWQKIWCAASALHIHGNKHTMFKKPFDADIARLTWLLNLVYTLTESHSWFKHTAIQNINKHGKTKNLVCVINKTQFGDNIEKLTWLCNFVFWAILAISGVTATCVNFVVG